jgi:hypothetical protein
MASKRNTNIRQNIPFIQGTLYKKLLKYNLIAAATCYVPKRGNTWKRPTEYKISFTDIVPCR